jgi:hypothetical protein
VIYQRRINFDIISYFEPFVFHEDEKHCTYEHSTLYTTLQKISFKTMFLDILNIYDIEIKFRENYGLYENTKVHDNTRIDKLSSNSWVFIN